MMGARALHTRIPPNVTKHTGGMNLHLKVRIASVEAEAIRHLSFQREFGPVCFAGDSVGKEEWEDQIRRSITEFGEGSAKSRAHKIVVGIIKGGEIQRQSIYRQETVTNLVRQKVFGYEVWASDDGND